MNRWIVRSATAVSSLCLVVACSSRRDETASSAAAVSEDGSIHCSAEADEHDVESQSADEAAEQAAAADTPAAWGDGQKHAAVAHVRILGLNDFHGQIMGPGKYGKSFTDAAGKAHGVGGIPVLTSWLKAAQASAPAGPESVVITHSGDFVGASIPQSGLLRDEPAVLWFNQLANDSCRQWQVAAAEGGYAAQGDGLSKRCNLVAALGNHEFDKGRAELSRKIYGGNAATGPYVVDDYPGAKYPYVAANVVDNATGKLILPPYEIKEIDGEKVAFIGAVTKATPSVVVPSGIEGLTFLDEATAINSYIPEIQSKKVHAIVVLIHEGGDQAFNASSVTATAPVTGRIVDIVANLNDDVDVVLSGHSHKFTNTLLPNAGGKPTLVTQAFSYSMAFAQVDLDIDNATHDVVNKVGRIQVAYADSGPGLSPDADAQKLVDAAVAAVGPKIDEVVGTAAVALVGVKGSGANFGGETNLGDLIADAQRVQSGAQFAFMNPGGIRANVAAGSITWGQLYAVQPFANDLVTETITGAQIWSALSQQWSGGNAAGLKKILQISGLQYSYHCTGNCSSTSTTAPPLFAVDWVKDASGNPIPNDGTTYTVAVNSFLAAGGDNFAALKGTNKVTRMVDLDALVSYVKAKGTVGAPIDTRIQRTF